MNLCCSCGVRNPEGRLVCYACGEWVSYPARAAHAGRDDSQELRDTAERRTCLCSAGEHRALEAAFLFSCAEEPG
jgi:hypothetical protein